MARARDPNRDKAKEMYLQSDGKIPLKDIAAELGKGEGTVRGWKKKDNWDGELNGTLQSNERNAPIKKTPKKKVVTQDEVIYFEQEGEGGLTDKQRLFVSYYVKYWNATKAYKKAYGCNYSTARAHGYKLLQNVDIREEIVKVRDALTEDALLDKRTLIQKWIDIAFADMTDYVSFGTQEITQTDEDGNKETFTVNYTHLSDSSEIDGTLITEVKKGKDGISIKLADKMKAIEYLSKHMDLLNDNERKRLQQEQMQLSIDKTRAEIAKIENPETNTQESEIAKMLRRMAGDE